MEIKEMLNLIKYSSGYKLSAGWVKYKENDIEKEDVVYFLTKDNKIEALFGTKLPEAKKYWGGIYHHVKIYDGCLHQQELNPTKYGIFDLKKGIIFESDDSIIVEPDGFKTIKLQTIATIKAFDENKNIIGLKSVIADKEDDINRFLRGAFYYSKSYSMQKITKLYDKEGKLYKENYEDLKLKSSNSND